MNYIPYGAQKLPDDYLAFTQAMSGNLKIGSTCVVFNYAHDPSSMGKIGDDIWQSAYIGYSCANTLLLLMFSKTADDITWKYCITGYRESDIRQAFKSMNELVAYLRMINRT